MPFSFLTRGRSVFAYAALIGGALVTLPSSAQLLSSTLDATASAKPGAPTLIISNTAKLSTYFIFTQSAQYDSSVRANAFTRLQRALAA